MSAAIEILRANPDETKAQEALLARVDTLLDDARIGQQRLHENYVEIGLAMLEVKTMKAWLVRTHSWDAYVLVCGQRLGKKRTALYGYTSVAEQLGPHVAPKQLVTMGISKSQPLAAYVKTSGKQPSPALLEAALDASVGVEEFRAALSEARHEKPEGEGKWFDLGGFYCTPPEREEIERAFRYAAVMDEIPENEAETVVRKRTIQALAREGISAWGPIVEKQ